MKTQPDDTQAADGGAPIAIIETAAEPSAAKIVDPSETGIEHLRSTDETAMILWSVKGPKKAAESTISAVLLDGPTIVLVHQFASGKFKVFSPEATPSNG